MKRLRLIALLMMMVMLFSVASTTVMAQSTGVDVNTFSRDDVDVYITRMDETILNVTDVSTLDYERMYADSLRAQEGETRASRVSSEGYSVTKHTLSELAMSGEPVFERLADMLNGAVSQGYVVHSVNVVLPLAEGGYTNNRSNDPSDPAYWIANTYNWGTHQGQNIRYYFASFSVSKPKADVGNRPSRWADVLNAFVNVAVDRLIGFTKFDTAYSAINDIKSVLGAARSVNVVFDSATEWVRSESVGTLTYREVVLEDIDNKVAGYAYYPWGSLQQLAYQTRIEVKYYRGIVNGSPSYPVITSPYSSMRYTSSPNYSNTSVLFPILRQHYNYFGYHMYSESVSLTMSVF